MAGTAEGAKKARQKRIDTYFNGDEEAYKEAMREQASRAGKKSTGRSFRDVNGLASKAGKLGAAKRWSK
jgi:hypothetical protein